MFEGLIEATRILGDERYRSVGLEVFDKHPFDEQRGLWLRVEYDGRVLGHDVTFNHQLWFAAAAADLLGASSIAADQRFALFMDNLTKNFAIRSNGRICHIVERRLAPLLSLATSKKIAKPLLRRLAEGVGTKSLIARLSHAESEALAKEAGYQAFNLYAFAMLSTIFGNHPFFASPNFQRAVSYLESTRYEEELNQNLYGYGYNSPGFEVPFCLTQLSEMSQKENFLRARNWIRRQICRTYDEEKGKFTRNTEDAVTLTARIYECTRFSHELLSANLGSKMV